MYSVVVDVEVQHVFSVYYFGAVVVLLWNFGQDF